MRVLVAMSGGVDSSVAAALLLEAGHQVVGATMKLWGGPSDSGCCSVADVDDARRVAEQLGIVHHVFNFSDDFEAKVVVPYVAAHRRGLTPNPCVECNRSIKFDRLLRRAAQLGFDAVATGHHARVARSAGGRFTLVRGRDRRKDQSYVVSMLGQAELARCLFPVGELTKDEVRARAASLGLRTATKPDSQDVCFITSPGTDGGGRAGFLGDRLDMHPGRLVEASTGQVVGQVGAVELVTVGQRRGLGAGPDGARRYALAVDVSSATVEVGAESELLCERTNLDRLNWVDGALAPGAPVLAQASAHGHPRPAVYEGTGLVWESPERRVAPGQTVALYRDDAVLGAGVGA